MRIGEQGLLGLLESRNRLLPCDRRKVVERVATLDVVEEGLERHAGTNEDRGSAEDLRVCTTRGLVLIEFPQSLFEYTASSESCGGSAFPA